jgi:hypothetical protein
VDDLTCKAIDGPPASADHLGRLEEEGWGDRQAELRGRLEIDDQLERGGLLHRQLGGVRALEDLVHVGGR